MQGKGVFFSFFFEDDLLKLLSSSGLLSLAKNTHLVRQSRLTSNKP